MVFIAESWPTRLAIMIVLAVGIIGCAPDRGPRRVADLVESLPTARISTETETIYFGDPALRELLGQGWFLVTDESGKLDRAWGTGRRSEMVFFRMRLEDLSLSLRGRSFKFEPGKKQRVSFSVNGQPVGESEFSGGPQEIQIQVPAEVLRFGENHLLMEYSESESREQAYPKMNRDRAVAWSRLTISPTRGVSGDSPTVDPAAHRLFIPFGSRVDFFLGELVDGEFGAERIDVRGADQGQLVVLSQSGEGAESVAGVLDVGWAGSPLSISGDKPVPVRLSLAAMGPRSLECGGPCGIVLTEPSVTSDPMSPPVEPEAAGVNPMDSSSIDRPNVIVYLIDALRADHLGCYGYDLPVSPHIDAFAEDAVLFERAQAQTSWTRASVASIFTGLMAQVHSANDDDDALSEKVVTIAEYLQNVGYQTAGMSANGNAGPALGFGQGFDVFRNLGPVRSEEVLAAASAWLDSMDPERPVFMWIHTVDPHAPYMPPDDLRAKFAPNVVDLEIGSVNRVADLTGRPEQVTPRLIADLVALYDAEIASDDRTFGVVMDELRRRNLFDNSLIIVVADHGEEFYDHGGWTHGKTLYAEQLDIPLIVKFPGQHEGRRIHEIVQHVDILPTILREVGIKLSQNIQGRSVQVLMDDAGRQTWENRSFSFLDLRGRTGSAVVDGRWKVIRFQDRATGHLAKLYDKQGDREEKNDLTATRPDVSATMVALERMLGLGLPEPIAAPIVDISEKEKMWADLKALGYVQ